MPLSLRAIGILGDSPEPTSLLVPGGRPRVGEGGPHRPPHPRLPVGAALRHGRPGLLRSVRGRRETAYDLDEAAVKKAVIASARRVVAAADGGKLGRTAHAHVGPASLVHLLVTDASAPADEVAALKGDGATVRTV